MYSHQFNDYIIILSIEGLVNTMEAFHRGDKGLISKDVLSLYLSDNFYRGYLYVNSKGKFSWIAKVQIIS